FVNFNFPTIGNQPVINGAPNPMVVGSVGGLQQLGNAQAHTHTLTLRPSFNANTTWIHGNHALKAGGEIWLQGNITAPPSGVLLAFNQTGTAPNYGATAEPFTTSLNGGIWGFPYANFLLGDATRVSQS